MARSKQHPRDGQHMLHTLITQLVQPIANHRCRKLQIAVFNWPLREFVAELRGNLRELADSRF